ncbi:MAG: TIGR03546 family protein [Campylobacteraceae bacterium]|jgi:uncharacterized protein (TIGR03546 family)|nr:TIGR03546 family protein [Campylobacteraceae bacterium]MBT3881822.1 TIGR03546 family protein [Campylobacteraceae bacterium]MBT4030364.1 TIGR03546 family protein [Campylobacteraceae bacterium]MBT4179671.1 TIGR03546 family protein [Campylobacteraceae bacterium]MBT4707184.1 TIGR03546 family protein [Campylobacteraceae bacterium]
MFFTLRKIWNILNDAGKPWQISLALSFGMIFSFMPLGLFSLVVLFLVLLLNVHIGMFLLSLALFSGFAVLFDPIFHQIGLFVLSSEGLNLLWTQLYNTPIFSVTNFNNTIMMGSIVVSLILFFPLFKFSNFILVKYREVIAVKLQNIPLLNKITYFHSQKEENIKIIRLTGLVIYITLVSLVAAFSLIFLDDIVKSSIQKAVLAKSNKEVQIGSLKLSIFDSKVDIKNLKILDNDGGINIKNISIDISLAQLILKKVVIENIIIDEIEFDKNSISNKEDKKEKESNLEHKFHFAKIPSIDTLNVEKLMNGNLEKSFGEYEVYIKKINEILNNDNKEKEVKSLARADGEIVKFKDISNIPNVLVENGLFSIVFNDNIYNGTFKDFTTNQELYGKPFKASLNLKGYKVDSFSQKGVTISNLLFDSKIDFELYNKNINANSNLDIKSVDIQLNQNNKYIKEINKYLNNITEIRGDIKVTGEVDNPSIVLKSNIDKIIKQKTKNVFKDVVKSKIKNKIEEKVQEKIEKQIGDKIGNKLKGLLKF